MSNEINTTPATTSNTAVRPEDLLPAGAESGVINGVEVRKGSVAAFLANAKLLDSVQEGSREEADVEAQIKALAPKLKALGMLDVFSVRSPRLAALIDAA
jgi:hypothetical protein